MLRSLCIATAVFAFGCAAPTFARERIAIETNGHLDSLISRYSAEYNVPESLIRRVIRRESGGNARVVHRGNYGLMQIKLATARSMGYQGGAAGLLDPDTNMRYAVKYLAGAWRLAGGSEARAVHHYAAGYYYAAKHDGMRVRGRRYAMLEGMQAFGSAVPATGGPVSPASPNFH